MKHVKRILPPLIAVFVAVSVAWAVASYPTSVKTFPTRVAGEVIQATWFNEPYDEITAIEGALLNGFAHALKPSTDAGQTLGTSALRWKQALLGLGTVTVDTPALDITGTWNAVAVAFTGIKANFTDTASAVASLLLDLQVGGVSKFKVDKVGLGTLAAGLTFAGPLLFSTDNAQDIGASGANRPRDIYVGTASTIGSTAVNQKNVVLQNSGALLILDVGNAAFPYAIADFTNDAGVQGRIAIPSAGGIEIDAAGTLTGLLLSVSGGGDIRWGKPLVALGGGAAPTLGTIGGSGPATAAQNSWMRVVDSAGAAFWVPAWK